MRRPKRDARAAALSVRVLPGTFAGAADGAARHSPRQRQCCTVRKPPPCLHGRDLQVAGTPPHPHPVTPIRILLSCILLSCISASCFRVSRARKRKRSRRRRVRSRRGSGPRSGRCHRVAQRGKHRGAARGIGAAGPPGGRRGRRPAGWRITTPDRARAAPGT